MPITGHYRPTSALVLVAERCHVEVTTLLVPGEYGSVEEVYRLADEARTNLTYVYIENC